MKVASHNQLHAGSPVIHGDVEDGLADDGTSDFHYSETQNEKQKVSEHILGLHMNYGRGEEIEAPKYDKEVSHAPIPLLTHGMDVCFCASCQIVSINASK